MTAVVVDIDRRALCLSGAKFSATEGFQFDSDVRIEKRPEDIVQLISGGGRAEGRQALLNDLVDVVSISAGISDETRRIGAQFKQVPAAKAPIVKIRFPYEVVKSTLDMFSGQVQRKIL